jgi:hypothetical protein
MQYTFNLSRTKVLTVLLALSLLLCFVVGVQYGASITTPTPVWTLNAPPASSFDWFIGRYSNGTYFAESGTWQTWSNDASLSTVISYVCTNAVVGSSVTVSAGVLGSKTGYCIIGNATETLTAGKIAYQSSPNYYTTASASASSTVGYGYMWLIVQTATVNNHCLLMDHGIFTLGSYSLSAGLQWVSTTGTVTSTYPTGAGNQIASIGLMVNATTILFNNPNGIYMEHI